MRLTRARAGRTCRGAEEAGGGSYLSRNPSWHSASGRRVAPGASGRGPSPGSGAAHRHRLSSRDSQAVRSHGRLARTRSVGATSALGNPMPRSAGASNRGVDASPGHSASSRATESAGMPPGRTWARRPDGGTRPASPRPGRCSDRRGPGPATTARDGRGGASPRTRRTGGPARRHARRRPRRRGRRGGSSEIAGPWQPISRAASMPRGSIGHRRRSPQEQARREAQRKASRSGRPAPARTGVVIGHELAPPAAAVRPANPPPDGRSPLVDADEVRRSGRGGDGGVVRVAACLCRAIIIER